MTNTTISNKLGMAYYGHCFPPKACLALLKYIKTVTVATTTVWLTATGGNACNVTH